MDSSASKNAAKRAFVIMPFSEELQEVYSELIKLGLEDAGFLTERADNIDSLQNILRDIVSGIVQADLIVADVTGLNANVLYELGIAHGLRKPTIMLTQNLDELPFDLRSYRVIPYSVKFSEAGALRERIREVALKQIDSQTAILGSGPVDDFVVISQASQSAVGTLQTPDARDPEFARNNDQPDGAGSSTEPDVPAATKAIVSAMDSMIKAYEELHSAGDRAQDEIRAKKIYYMSVRDPGALSKLTFDISRDLMSITAEYDQIETPLQYILAKLPETFAQYFPRIDPSDHEQREAVEELIAITPRLQASMREAVLSFQELRTLASEYSGLSEGLAFSVQALDRELGNLSEVTLSAESYLSRMEELLKGKLAAKNA